MIKLFKTLFFMFAGSVFLCWAYGDPTPATQPSSADRAALEVRANNEFNAERYASALPMLQKLAALNSDRPDTLGPINEKIRVCEKNVGAGGAAAPGPSAALASGGPATLARTDPSSNAARKPHPAPHDGQVLEMSIKELGNFDYDNDNGGNIPADVVALSGHPIRLRGFMIPIDQAANITQFALVTDLFSCCFGKPPQIQHTIAVTCPKGKGVNYYPDEITVEGVLNVAEKRDEGFIVSIFEVQASSVKPSPK